jgi:uncharacterized membrane protein YsdA (DUF1294 family)/cold shock CspA family protein
VSGSARFQGRVTEWRDAQGYGFITPNGGGEPVFVHIKAFAQPMRRPAEDDQVSYLVAKDAKGRVRAERVEHVGIGTRPGKTINSKRLLLLLGFGFLGFVLVQAIRAKLSPVVATIYLLASAMTFYAYSVDKSAARGRRWRTQESTLQVMSLLGGWPGALAGQQMLRHKTRKVSFQVVFWLTVIVNLATFVWLCSAAGASFLAALFTR